MPYLVQSLFDFLHVGLIDRGAGVDPFGDLIDIFPDGRQLSRKCLYVGGVGIDDISVNRHLAKIGADPLCGELGHLLFYQFPVLPLLGTLKK